MNDVYALYALREYKVDPGMAWARTSFNNTELSSIHEYLRILERPTNMKFNI